MLIRAPSTLRLEGRTNASKSEGTFRGGISVVDLPCEGRDSEASLDSNEEVESSSIEHEICATNRRENTDSPSSLRNMAVPQTRAAACSLSSLLPLRFSQRGVSVTSGASMNCTQLRPRENTITHRQFDGVAKLRPSS